MISLLLLLPGAAWAWWGDAYKTPTGLSGGWATHTDCGTYWYTYGRNTSCTAFNRWAQFIPGFVWHGKGYIHMDWVYTGAYGLLGQRLRYYNCGNGLSGEYSDVDMCANTCSWKSVLDGVTGNLYIWNGIYIDCNESWTTGCGNRCGYASTSCREIHMYGDKWVYLNDWIVFGGYGSSSVSDTANRNFPWGESGLYAYPFIDGSANQGKLIVDSLFSGKVPFRVTTGDCGQGNYLNFKGNASNGGNNNCDNCDAYAFAWVHTSGGAGPQLGVGADDGHRIWINGTMVSDNNNYTGGWDSYNPGAKSLATGWNRVLFKVHNGGGAFTGTLSFHHGTAWNQMEPSVSLQSDRYGGFSVGYEQNDWYPRLFCSNANGVTGSPAAGLASYSNNTTVTASGTASGSFIPLWTVMLTTWGYNQNSAFRFVTSPGATWSDTQTGITGHVRLHYMAVSKSGRHSGQASGSNGNWTWNNTGNCYWFDAYVDNLAPLNPSFSSVNAISPSQINLSWSLPLDRGCGGVANGADEATAANSSGDNWYRAGNVGVQVYRDASAIYGWGTGTSKNDTGLSANTKYTYTIAARDNTGETRGAWHNATAAVGTTSKYTLQNPATAPTFGTITANSIALVTTGPVNLAADNSGVIFKRNGTTDLAKAQALTTTDGGLAANTQYSYTARGVNGDNVATAESASASAWTLSVAPAAGTVTAAAVTYGDEVSWTAVNGFGAGKVQYYRYAFDQNATKTSWTDTETQWSSGVLKVRPTAAGTWYLHIKGYNGANVGNGYYNYAVTVNKKALTVTGLTAQNKVYDATTTAPLSGTAALLGAEALGSGSTSDGKPYTGDDVSVGGTAAGTFSNKDVGTGKAVTVTGCTLSGAQAGNYTATQPAGLTADITPKALTVTGLTAQNKVYDATTAASLSGAAALLAAEDPGTGSTSDGKPYTGDAVSAGGTAAGTFSNKDVGTGKVVTVTGCTLSGAQAGNYTATQPTGLTADITPKALTITGLSAVNKFYDGTTAVTLSGAASLLAAEGPGTGTTSDGKPYTGDAVSVGGTATGEFADRNVGTDIAVNISGVSLSGAQSGNYTADLAVRGDILDTKTDLATTTIVDANSANFGLTLNAGTLLANASESINGTGTVTVNSGATLGGSGKAGTAVVNSGGTLAPGAGAGVLGTLTLGAAPSLGGTVAMKIKKTSGPVYAADKLSLSAGELSYGGTLTVTELGGGVPLAGGDVFELFDAAGGFDADSSFSTFNLPALPTPPQGEPAVNWYTGHLTVDGTIIINRAPKGVQDHVLTRAPGTSMKINIATLRTTVMAGVEDLDSGDAASYDTLASFTSNRGTVVTESGGRYLYAPNHNCNDYLEYRVKDQRGGAVTAKIRILVEPYYGKVELRHDGGGTVSLLFYGIPGYDYYIQRKCTVEGTWADLYGPLTCTAAGLVTHDDTPGGCNPAFYRLRTAGEVCQ